MHKHSGPVQVRHSGYPFIIIIYFLFQLRFSPLGDRCCETPQHCRSSKMRVTCDGCFTRQSIYSVIFHDYIMWGHHMLQSLVKMPGHFCCLFFVCLLLLLFPPHSSHLSPIMLKKEKTKKKKKKWQKEVFFSNSFRCVAYCLLQFSHCSLDTMAGGR